jgi:Zn ribbon nucleic-acid-binding protein
MDKLVVDTETDKRECVACGFSEERPQGGGLAELPTRVTRPAARRVETEAEAVKLVGLTTSEDNQK